MDKFTLSAAAAHLVTAYRKVAADLRQELNFPLDIRLASSGISGGVPPSTYGQLIEQAARGVIYVDNRNGETSIYGRDGNISFRSMHDLGHLVYQMDFGWADEIDLAHQLWTRIKRYIPAEWRRTCHNVYLADTVGQTLYERRKGAFPPNQKEFVLGWFNDR